MCCFNKCYLGEPFDMFCYLVFTGISGSYYAMNQRLGNSFASHAVNQFVSLIYLSKPNRPERRLRLFLMGLTDLNDKDYLPQMTGLKNTLKLRLLGSKKHLTITT